MFTFSIQCFNPTKNEIILNTQFCVLSKGLNSGKPLEKPGQNCFIITASNPEQKNFYFGCVGVYGSQKNFIIFLLVLSFHSFV